jgi:hypothetical protein
VWSIVEIFGGLENSRGLENIIGELISKYLFWWSLGGVE